MSDVYKADWRSNNIYYEMSADLLSREREGRRERVTTAWGANTPASVGYRAER